MSAANEINHMLEVVRGPAIERGALVKSTKLSSNVTITVYQGRVVHLNSDGEYETGATGTQMPLFVMRPSNALDVKKLSASYTSLNSGAYQEFQGYPTGNFGSYVATGGFEFQTTEYDTSRDYTINDLLTATVANSTQATGGRLTNAGNSQNGFVRPFLDAACGVVSGLEFTNHHRVSVLPFWSIYLPQAVNP